MTQAPDTLNTPRGAPPGLPGALGDLARAAGVVTSYITGTGELCRARPDIVLAVLRQLGVAIERVEDAGDALERLRRDDWSAVVSPCAASFGGADAVVELRLPASVAGRYRVELTTESGRLERRDGALSELPVVASANLGGVVYVARELRVAVPEQGYHRAAVTVPGVVSSGAATGETTASCAILAAPGRAHTPRADTREWGVFAPLYGLRREGGSAVGDLGELRDLARWTAGLGGGFVGTLPLLATYLEEPFEPSPYSPVSRLFWNELFVDPARAPGVADIPEMRAALEGSPADMAEAAALRALATIDYRREAALRRRTLARLADIAWRAPGMRAQLEAAAAEHPRLHDYAQFRAATDRTHLVWLFWPEPRRGGALTEADYDADAYRYHVYAQYAMDRQLAAVSGECALYLDQPVGVDRAGYDTWRDRDLFGMDTSVGAPPDALFTGGQDWGVPPLIPRVARATGHRYFAECVRAHARHAGMLRVDHVMGLHRQYWVPLGATARDGVYVRFPYEELYAVLCIESQRRGCAVIGEDLGTVPREVRELMEERGLARLFVGQFSLPGLVAREDAADADAAGQAGCEGDDAAGSGAAGGVGAAGGGDAAGPATGGGVAGAEDPGIEPPSDNAIVPPPYSMASLNTHDMPSFAGFWRGGDIDIQVEMGLLDADRAAAVRAEREELYRQVCALLREHGVLADTDASGTDGDADAGDAELRAVMEAYTRYLAASDATWVMVNLEDLWLEREPQNVPGTWRERPNWRRPMQRSLEAITTSEAFADVLRAVARARAPSRAE